MAEIGLAVLSSRCPGPRTGSAEELQRELLTWSEDRNEAQVEDRW